ncbi:Crp/Fnr family transcriptional regulator [Mucilaginibacter sp. SMC90]|uniref:Crp/Fnr family transcriptional regulator n=1 Tax=Mucilaginibacter sp. SMC90 TaxID=2929803 RepID=UPI001FB1B3D4|nr:Crp/Fnr family transcriptional regulator [Mucilaginibacter sp. SMC90]UOE48944.1 Crp/Fnr family transcriptional regulator [Mucilaginibacter sp. SMC90]
MQQQLIARLQQLKPIPVNDQELIANAFVPMKFKEGDTLLSLGHVARQLFFITNGVLRIMAQSDKGNEVTYFFLKDNQFCTILYSFNNNMIAEEGIQAACDTELLAISKNNLLALYEKLPYLKEIIDQISQNTLLEKIKTRNAYLGYDSSERYQLFLERQPEVAMRVPLTDIASYLGVTPQSLSRIRKNIR